MVRASGKVRRLLLEAGLVTDEEWNSACQRGGDVLESLVSNGTVEEGALLEVLGQEAGVAPLDLSRVDPDPMAIELLPRESWLEHQILPISRNGDILTIATGDPFDVLLFDDLRRRTGCQVRLVAGHGPTIRQALEKLFETGRREVDKLLDEVQDSTGEIEVGVEDADEDLEVMAAQGDEAPAVKLVNLILLRALREKASDIHIEPGDKKLTVRYRIDGRLRVVMTPPKALLPALSSRLKILAQLDIAERQKPQDGKFQIRYEGRQIDFRLSILPVVGGEKAVMRILDTGALSLRLDKMGYEERTFNDIQRAIHSPYGMLLITGPTGSGKSTTLYSCVQEVATPEINVTTVEDPVEYRMEGIAQVPVNPKRGLTFAGALRSILRQDPDVVLVGEIRDAETADIAVKAALTGHLVLSTLHTNDAASTITRLVDMGIDPFMVSSSLLCVGAQRLARKLCPHCRWPIEVPEPELLAVGFRPEEIEGLQLYGPNVEGCSRCTGGYKGRFAILETMFVCESLKRMIVQGRSVLEIKAEAIRQGMLTLRRVGLLNAMRGRTSLEEVLRVTLADDRTDSE